MRLDSSVLAIAALTASVSFASAQGLLSLQSQADFKKPEPLTVTTGVGVGYDTLNYKASNANDIDSLFVRAGAGLTYSKADQISPYDLGVDFGAIHYLDDTNRTQDTDYSARAVFNISHAASERLKFVNNFYLSYEVEPNFGLGASTALRNGQYFYGYNNFAASYAWSERFSTTTSYTIDGIKYDDSQIGQMEDRLSHLISQQFAWAWTKTAKIVGEYRYRTVDYRHANTDYHSHYLLAGVDKAWSERTNGSFRAGAEFYSSQRSDKTAPYFEASLSHATSERTTLQVFTSVGFDGSEIGNYGSRYSYRLGASATHQVSKKLRINGGVNYAYSTFDGIGLAPDVNEHEFSATAGLGYQVWRNVGIDANYSYTILSSDDSVRDYDRNRVSLGLSAQF
jgi:hypothetical protein